MSDYVSRGAIKDAMLRYGFKAPDMTVTEFVEDELPAADVEPVQMCIGFCKKFKKYDTVLVPLDQYINYCKCAGLPLDKPKEGR